MISSRSCFLAFALFILSTTTWAENITREQIQFKGKSFPVSALKQRIAKTKGLAIKSVEPDTLSAHLYKPEDGKKFPAIIMVHDCRGVQPYQHDWAKQVADWGFVVLLMDSFTTRKIDSTCQGLGEQENFLIHGGRVQDVFAAHDFLSQQDYVEKFRIGLMGWDYHSVLGAVAKHGMQQKFDISFMGAVAIYPSCNATSGTDFVSPILVLVGEDDDWTPARECRIMERYARAGQESVQLRYFKNTKHGFDDPSTVEEVFYPDFRNYFKSPARGVTMQYNQQAHQASIKVVRQFLDFNIKYRPIQITLDDLPSEFTAQQIENADWINHPDDYGPDIPPLGYSLFDKVFSIKKDNVWHHDVPFPFDKLLAKLSAVVDQADSSSSKLKSVLIPSGRSLVRNAAAPDFFEFPRVVVAVDTEPPIKNNQYSIMLKDRLYVAYQEKANALEVISYNETDQRYEYQVVKNYTENKRPTVEYANRSLCLSCHQNHAPIFANAPWDETNFNEQVFTKIKSKRQHFYGLIPAVPVASSANSIDRSTNRATLAPVYNALWQQGCNAENREVSVKCRSEAFKAMLQYRLSNKSGFDKSTLNYQTNFLRVASTAWQNYWPDGLAIPAANITDRNPFTEKMEVSARFDPLTRRPPQTIWFGSNARNIEQVIIGLADQLLKTDIKALDDFLVSSHQTNSDSIEYTNDCTIKKTDLRGDTLKASIDCKNRNRTEENNFDLHGTLNFGLRDQTISGRFNSIRRQDEFILHDIRFDRLILDRTASNLTVSFPVHHKKSTLRVRLPSGNAIKSFKLELKPEQINKDLKTIKADLSFDVLRDFDRIDHAITELTTNSVKNSSELFSLKPFSASRYFSALMSKMGATNIPRYCCLEDPFGLEKKPASSASMNIKDIDFQNATPSELISAICGRCHRNEARFPPNFLSGNSEQIQRKLRQCAPRISYRLHMWTFPDNSRKKTPMPPVLPVLATQDLDAGSWSASSAYTKIKKFMLALIESPLTNEQLLAQLLKTPYERLDKCITHTVNTISTIE